MIVCLGWGSLVWKSGLLKLDGEWQDDGPLIAVEYLRQSDDGRLTLVIDNEDKSLKLKVLWVKMKLKSLEEAQHNLSEREGCSRNKIAIWKYGHKVPESIPDLENWAYENSISGVIWTNLQPRFNGVLGNKPSGIEAVKYLEGLTIEKKELAEEYIRKTPVQIKTNFRTLFEEKLNWYPKK